jgi:serpin B
MRGRPKLVAVVVALAAAAAACGGNSEPKPSVATDAVATDAVAMSNGVGFALLDGLRDGGDVAVAPPSVTAVLAMLHAGARGETATAIASVLGATTEDDPLAATGSLSRSVASDGDVVVELAASIWADDGIDVDESFAGRVGEEVDADVQLGDLGDDVIAAEIDRWAEERTGGAVDGLAAALGLPDAAAVIALLTTARFDAQWTEPFDPARTTPTPFHRNDGTIVEVPMMARDGTILRARGEDFDLVRLPYGADGRIVADVVLPDGAIDGFSLGIEAWTAATGALSESATALRLPRFDLRFRPASGAVDRVLSSLGMVAAYDADADFTGIARDGGAALSTVVQAAQVTVDEDGTRAAAATGAVLQRGAPEPFVADRPFVFVISDTTSGAVLFLGVLMSGGSPEPG